MKEMTIREIENLPSLYINGDISDIRNYKVGDYYLMKEPDYNYDIDSVISVYKVINKKSSINIESKVVMVRIK